MLPQPSDRFRLTLLLFVYPALVVLLGCSGHDGHRQKGRASPEFRDFLQFSETFAAHRIDLGPVIASRVEVGRPLVFSDPDSLEDTVTVLDGRRLVGRKKIRAGQRVELVFQCTEGRTDRGNLLLDIELEPGDPVPPSGENGDR